MKEKTQSILSFRFVRNCGLFVLFFITVLVSVFSYYVFVNVTAKINESVHLERTEAAAWRDLSFLITECQVNFYDFVVGKQDLISPTLLITQRAIKIAEELSERYEEHSSSNPARSIVKDLKKLKQGVFIYTSELRQGYGQAASGLEMQRLLLWSFDDISKIIKEELKIINAKVRSNHDKIIDIATESTAGLQSVLIAAFFVTVIIALLLNRAISNPIRELVHATQHVANGDFSHSIVAVTKDEIGQLYTAFNDMTDQLRDQRLKLVEKDYFDSIMSGMSEMLIVMNGEGIITTVNKMACDILEYSQEELVWERLEKVLCPEENFIDSFSVAAFLISPEMKIVHANELFLAILSCDKQEILNQYCSGVLHRDDCYECPGVKGECFKDATADKMVFVPHRLRGKEGESADLDMFVVPITDHRGIVTYYLHLMHRTEPEHLKPGNEHRRQFSITPRMVELERKLRKFHVENCLAHANITQLPEVRNFEITFLSKNCHERYVLFSSASVKHESKTGGFYIMLCRDIEDIKSEQAKSLVLERELQQAQKLQSIGTMTAGIAHEINTPLQFITYNMTFLEEALNVLLPLIPGLFPGEGDLPPQTQKQVDENYAKDMHQEVVRSLDQTRGGLSRISNIIKAMRKFSYVGEEEKKLGDINDALENAITITHNIWKHHARLDKKIDATVPAVECLIGELNQVFANLIVNAVHAIEDTNRKQGTITVETRNLEDSVEIRIGDDGCGIREEIRHKIFDPFFTTKDIGRGTGQGLPLIYSCIVERHGGAITFDTAVGKGTTFIITLPKL